MCSKSGENEGPHAISRFISYEKTTNSFATILHMATKLKIRQGKKNIMHNIIHFVFFSSFSFNSFFFISRDLSGENDEDKIFIAELFSSF